MLEVHERMAMAGASALSDGDLLKALVGCDVRGVTMDELAWATVPELEAKGFSAKRAALLAAAFELGRRGGWKPPLRGERCLDPRRVYEVMKPQAFEERETFSVILLDVRGRLIRSVKVAQGSLSQCPVNPRDVLRIAVKEGAHGIVFVHNHPSGDPSPSPDDVDLTERLRAAAELVGILARDHVIVAAGGYYSFVEAGRWRR